MQGLQISTPRPARLEAEQGFAFLLPSEPAEVTTGPREGRRDGQWEVVATFQLGVQAGQRGQVRTGLVMGAAGTGAAPATKPQPTCLRAFGILLTAN